MFVRYSSECGQPAPARDPRVPLAEDWPCQSSPRPSPTAVSSSGLLDAAAAIAYAAEQRHAVAASLFDPPDGECEYALQNARSPPGQPPLPARVRSRARHASTGGARAGGAYAHAAVVHAVVHASRPHG